MELLRSPDRKWVFLTSVHGLREHRVPETGTCAYSRRPATLAPRRTYESKTFDPTSHTRTDGRVGRVLVHRTSTPNMCPKGDDSVKGSREVVKGSRDPRSRL